MFSAENLFRAIDLIPASVYVVNEKNELKLPLKRMPGNFPEHPFYPESYLPGIAKVRS